MKKGFTLVELLVVIAVIAIIAAIIVAAINPLRQLERARDARRKSNIAQIARALENYLAANGYYPNWTTNGDDPSDGASDESGHPSWAGIQNPPNPDTLPYALTPAELKKLPLDPLESCPTWGAVDCYKYLYIVVDSGDCYGLYANLENNSDPQRGGPYGNGNWDFGYNCTSFLP